MKKCVTFLLVALLCSSAAWAAFTDVPEKSWYSDAVGRVVADGIMAGTSEQTFSPALRVTRGTVVTVLWRLMESPAVPGISSFPDLTGSEWYATAANWACRAGIASGYSSGLFGGDDPITREQLAVLLYRFSAFQGMELADGTLSGYRDAAKISPWARPAFSHAVGAGLMTGNEDGRLNPGGWAQRSELAVMLVRFLTPAAG